MFSVSNNRKLANGGLNKVSPPLPLNSRDKCLLALAHGSITPGPWLIDDLGFPSWSQDNCFHSRHHVCPARRVRIGKEAGALTPPALLSKKQKHFQKLSH